MFQQTPRARAVDLRTYCRPLDEEGSAFESREQMIKRAYVEHHKQLYRANGRKPDGQELVALERLALEGKSSLAGRTQWLGGTPYAHERACCQYNCAYSTVDSVYSLVDVSWMLLNGSGVGFSPRAGVLHGYTKPIPELVVVPSERPKDYRGRETNEEVKPDSSNDFTWTIRVGDSAAAWAKAGGKLFSFKGTAKRLVLDFSEVRGPGGRLKGYGWICNGHEPLAIAFRAIHNILNDNAGNLLDEIQIMDVVNWWGSVLSSRRSAQLCQLDEHNPRVAEYQRAKYRYWDTNPQRRQSNNGISFWSKPSKARIEEVLRHADECGGCPSMINASALLDKAGYGERINPCYAPETLVITAEGALRIEALVGREATIWDGNDWRPIDNFRCTGTDREVLKVDLQDGSSIRVTPQHTMVLEDGTRIEAQDLGVGDRLLLTDIEYDGPISAKGAYLKGFLIGDGTSDAGVPSLRLYSTKYMCQQQLIASALELPIDRKGPDIPLGFRKEKAVDRMTMTGLGKLKSELAPWASNYKKGLPDGVYCWDRKSKCEFVAGLFDADGCAVDTAKGYSYQIVSIHRPFLAGLQMLLKSMGVRSKIGIPRAASFKDMPGGTYYCRESWRLTISQHAAKKLAQQVMFERLTSFANRMPSNAPRSRAGRVEAVTRDGIEEKVYCCTVPGTHTVALGVGVITGQCGETILANRSVCNVVTNCLPRFRKKFAELERAIYTIARANYRQTCVDMRDGVLTPEWHQTNESLRLCGVSLTGIVQADWITNNQIRRMRNAAIAGAYSMADEWNLPRPKAITLGKPEGTGSKAFGGLDVGEIAEGMNRPLGRYILNWINFSMHDPLVGLLEAAGYRSLPNPSDPHNVLVCFPVEYSNIRFDVFEGKEVNFEPATAQLDRYLRWTTLWADHNMSCTISYSPHEIGAIVDWIDRNWDLGFLAASFLRRNDPTKTARDLGHPYLPQEVTTEGPFREYQAQLRDVDWAKVTGLFEISDASDCVGGACPVR